MTANPTATAPEAGAPVNGAPLAEVKDAVLAAAKTMHARGLVEGTAGNVSGRVDDGTVVLTPSSLSYEAMTLDDLVVVDLDGEVVSGDRSPTSEKAVHLCRAGRLPGGGRRGALPRPLRLHVRGGPAGRSPPPSTSSWSTSAATCRCASTSDPAATAWARRWHPSSPTGRPR